MFGGIIFDLDGTLVDSLGDIAASLNAVLAAEGMAVRSPDEIRSMIGDGMSILVRRALGRPSGNDAEIARIRGMVETEYDSRCLLTTRPYWGVPELLALLRERGLRLAVLSNKPDAFAASMVAALFPTGTFSIVRGQRPGVPTKPDPVAALAIAGEWGLAPSRIVFVGDSSVDIITAHNAGMAGLGAAWGFRGREELERAGAEAVFGSPLEIVDWPRVSPGATLNGIIRAGDFPSPDD